MTGVALSAVLSALVALQAAASGFLLLLTAAALGGPARGKPPTRQARHRFAIIVPAHNEELLLGGLLESIEGQRYPKGMFAVHVIADNCDDGTAEVAGRRGAAVHVRTEPQSAGKGQALRWLLDRLDTAAFDAFVFVDADSRMDPDFLRVIDGHLQQGEGEAFQGSYRVLSPESSPLRALRAMGFALMHDLRGRGKARLGVSCGLWGNGMVFTRELMQRYGWRSSSAVEDAEQHLALVLAGIKVRYAPHARVYGDMPATLADARSQQQRWEGGRSNLLRRFWRPLTLAALRRGNVSALVALVELALPPLSLLAPAGAALAVAAWLWGTPATGVVAIAGLAALGAYVAVGLLLSGLPPRTYAALVHAPRFVIWKLWLYLRALASRGEPAWIRTRRAG